MKAVSIMLCGMLLLVSTLPVFVLGVMEDAVIPAILCNLLQFTGAIMLFYKGEEVVADEYSNIKMCKIRF